MEYDDFVAQCPPSLNVPRETFEKLAIYVEELIKWNKKINLIAPSTVSDIWQRHIVDSLQIVPHAPENATSWGDLGAGGGLPALVLAAILPQRFSLIESDQRKSSFLRTAARKMDIDIEVIVERIEAAPRLGADVISARALAALPKLLTLAQPHGHADTVYLFPKGKNWKNELTLAQESWQMEVQVIDSLTDPEAKLLKLSEVSPL